MNNWRIIVGIGLDLSAVIPAKAGIHPITCVTCSVEKKWDGKYQQHSKMCGECYRVILTGRRVYNCFTI
ncbi:hypothetical protein KAU32_11030, partial [bacterium]|nr:hypothetical protein [bacterium]